MLHSHRNPSSVKVQNELACEVNHNYTTDKSTFCRTPVFVATEFVNVSKQRQNKNCFKDKSATCCSSSCLCKEILMYSKSQQQT